MLEKTIPLIKYIAVMEYFLLSLLQFPLQ